MKTTIVYTLVGDSDSVYLGQAIISAYTVRQNNSLTKIVIVTDKETGIIVNRIPNVSNYFDNVITVPVPDELNNLQASRYIKTKLRDILRGDYLFIDTDTVIIGDLSLCDSLQYDVAAVIDRHSSINNHPVKVQINRELNKVGLSIDDLDGRYFNSGVMFVKDSQQAHKLYELWHLYWDEARRKNYNIDQPPLAKANKECGYLIHELPGIWNCQMVDNFINIMDHAKVLHYFASHKRSPYKLYDETLLKKVAETGIIDDDLKAALEHPKSLFRERHLLVHDEDVAFNHSYVYDMFAYHKWVFDIFETVSRFFVTKSFKK